MILVNSETIENYVKKGWWSEQTIGDLLLHWSERRASELAVVDPPNKFEISGCRPERWTWGELLVQVAKEHRLQGRHQFLGLVSQLS